MYYMKLGNAYNTASGRNIDQKYPANPQGFEKQRPEWEIVGAFGADPIQISAIVSGSGGTPSSIVTVTTSVDHELQAGTPIKIEGVTPNDYNISTVVQSVSQTIQEYSHTYFQISERILKLPVTHPVQL